MRCPKCQAENHESRSKCWQCGASLSGSGDTPQAGTPAPSRPAPSKPKRKDTQLGGGAKVGILAASFLLPIAGLIWGIVWLVSGTGQKKTWGTAGVVASVVFGAAWGIGVPLTLKAITQDAKARAQQSSCLSNEKQLALGILMYAQDYDEVFPDARNWRTVVYPYVGNKLVFECPNGGYYAMNPRLSRAFLRPISAPASTVLLYEVDADGRQLKSVHNGGANYAFADGHCKWLSADAAHDF